MRDRNKLGLNDWIKDTVDEEEAKKAKEEAKKADKKADKKAIAEDAAITKDKEKTDSPQNSS